MSDVAISTVGEHDLPDLLPLMRGYCEFYEVDPPDDALLSMSHALIGDPEREGAQFIARAPDGAAVGFATVFWSWSTLAAARIAVMNDLYVSKAARRQGVGEALIQRCLDLAAEHGAAILQWQTALDNHSAQALYDRVGAVSERWLDYFLVAPRKG